MDEKKYKLNEQIIRATTDIFKEHSKLMRTSDNEMIQMIGLTMSLGIDKLVEAVKENTEYDCKQGTLNKVAENLMKDQSTNGN